MPIDPMILDPMLGTFRAMAQECARKGFSGPDHDQLQATMARMEQLGREMNDINTFMGVVSNEQLFNNFSTYYSRLLAAEAQQAQRASAGGGYDDGAFLRQRLDGLRQSVERLRQGSRDAAAEATRHARVSKHTGRTVSDLAVLEKLDATALLIPPIEEAIRFGEQPGMTFPRFERELIVRGLDKAMEGDGALERGLHLDLAWAEQAKVSPYHMQEAREKVELHARMKQVAEFGLVDSFEFSIERRKIEHRWAPAKADWSWKWYRFSNLIDDLASWSTSFTSYAPTIDPWRMARDPRRACRQDQECDPGYIAVRLAIIKEYWGTEFLDIFSHETFHWEVGAQRFGYSQEYTEFLVNAVWPHCRPLGSGLPRAVIAEQERLYRDLREQNPGINDLLRRTKQHVEQWYGPGTYEDRHGPLELIQSNAAPWSGPVRVQG